MQNPEKSYKRHLKLNVSFSKLLILFILINAEAQIWCSYLLAWSDKIAIADAISVQTTITVVGAVLGYLIKALIENLSKYSNIFGKKQDCNQCDIVPYCNEQEDENPINEYIPRG